MPRPPRLLPCAALLLALSALAALFATAAPALAETTRVSIVPDPAASPAQARQTALERAFVEAVAQDALRILPAPLAPQRAEALKGFLAPRARDLVMSYQEAPAAKAAPAPTGAQSGPAAAAPSATAQVVAPLDFDIEVNRPALRGMLQRLGLLSGGTRTYSLRLGPGVAEADLRALDELNRVMGLERVPGGAPLDITLERLPQGYIKAVLRQPGPSGAAASQAPLAPPIAADGQELPAAWQNIWGLLFAGKNFRPGGAARWVDVSGWRGVDGVHDFDRLLSGWDDAVQDVVLAGVELRSTGNAGGLSARWSVRVVNPARLAEHLRGALASRGLTLSRPEALLGGGAQP